VGADHTPVPLNTTWHEIEIPEPPLREDPWAKNASLALQPLISAANLESEEPNAQIAAYHAAQGKEVPEAPEELDAAVAAMEAAKGFLEGLQATMSEGRMTTLRSSLPDASVKEAVTATDDTPGKPKIVEARFECSSQVVLLEAPWASTVEGAVWQVVYAGDAAGAPPKVKEQGYHELNIAEFWEKLDKPDSHEAYRFLCWVRGVDHTKVATNTIAEVAQDYHFCVLLFLREQNLTAEQAMHVMRLADDLYSQSVSSGCVHTQRGTYDLDRSHKLLKAGLLSLTAPPLPHKPMLSQSQASALVQYFAKTFYTHYGMYVYLHIYSQAEDKVARELPVETPMPPLATTSAITEEQYQEKLRQEEEARRKAEESRKRDEEAQMLTKMLEDLDPDTEKVVGAVVRRQERAMRRQYDEHYQQMEDQVKEMEAKAG